jgi:hypothetical protein
MTTDGRGVPTPSSPFVSPETVVGMAVYTAKAMLRGKGNDLWEMLVENVPDRVSAVVRVGASERLGDQTQPSIAYPGAFRSREQVPHLFLRGYSDRGREPQFGHHLPTHDLKGRVTAERLGLARLRPAAALANAGFARNLAKSDLLR